MTTIAAFYLVLYAYGGGTALTAIPMASLAHCETAAAQLRVPSGYPMSAKCVASGFQP